jgi:hypothetical protein
LKASRRWQELDSDQCNALKDALKFSALVQVKNELGLEGLVLVQEDGMAHKPSLLTNLNVADILRYWSLLTSEQRAEFLEAKGMELSQFQKGAEIVARAKLQKDGDSLFDRVAGFFHAFGCLERSVRQALKEGRESEADYRLLGDKYDSLKNLLARMAKEDDKLDPVDRYLILLSGRQVLEQLSAEDAPESRAFFKARRDRVQTLTDFIKNMAQECRTTMAASEADLPAFLDWFDRWFLKRAKVAEAINVEN